MLEYIKNKLSPSKADPEAASVPLAAAVEKTPANETMAAAVQRTPANNNARPPPSLPPFVVPPSTVTSSPVVSAQKPQSLLFNCAVNEANVFTGNTDREVAEYYKERFREAEAVNVELWAKLSEKERGRHHNYVGRGVNKLTAYKMDQDDLANYALLQQWTQEEVFTLYKFLFFSGNWMTWSDTQPHPFAEALMAVITVPPMFASDVGFYYRDKALPAVHKKMTNMRGNVVKAMKTVFQTLYHSAINFSGVGSSFDNLLQCSKDWSDLVNDARAQLELFDLIYHYAGTVFGRQRNTQWLKKNRDKSLLDNLHHSDLSFALLCFENYSEIWIDNMKTKRMQPSEHDDEEASLDEPPSKKTKVSQYRGKFMKPANVKLRYLETGWTEDGMKRYNELCRMFEELMGRADVWQLCKDKWEVYILEKKEANGKFCWVPVYLQQDDDEDDADGDEDVKSGGWFDFKGTKSSKGSGGYDSKATNFQPV